MISLSNDLSEIETRQVGVETTKVLALSRIRNRSPRDVAGSGGDVLIGMEDGDIVSIWPGVTVLHRPPYGFWGHPNRAATGMAGMAVWGLEKELYWLDTSHAVQEVHTYDSNDTRSVPLALGQLRRVWADATHVLRALGTSGGSFWDVTPRSGGETHILAYDAVGQCGHPLSGGYAFGLDQNGKTVRALPVDGSHNGYIVNGIPLQISYCLAVNSGVIAITGRHLERPAVAIYDEERWFLVHLSPSHSVLEPVIYNDVIVVGAPEEDYRKSSGEAIRAAGAAYLIEKQDGTWGVRRKFVSAVPRKHGLLGHNLATNGNKIYINHLVGSQRGSDYGDIALCQVSLNGSH